ncbi:MAG: 16S rRNA (adenine(1518)-N(6)/adenine(1519)-N(6))-dimethyltransferase RsmA [Phoenicibacter congonensis]|uniref:Ribosomal RNA small subunit methyltransferase A n=1 Tax=Phoenicibacter congonensis TaxID=1944646 RepID=A0AA43RLZ3_9ACTN|nr:16S rRNA (adenine(1518)-N(6)/adenine(1519)-N(6))-dimethyltransferase RsmA [Phoenicibacter congonensis]
MSSSTLTNPTVASKMLAEHGIELSHALGQNFLINGSVVERTIALAEVNENDRVLEVGPGIGALTVPLLETGARVTSIEMDERLYDLIRENAAFAGDSFTLVEGDALDEKLLHSQQDTVFASNKLVANLPYGIAATLVLRYLQIMPALESVTVMVQKEVADRMMATVGTKNYGAYTVKLRLYADPAGSFFVGRNNFLPAPRVDSAIIKLTRHARHQDSDSAKILKNACIAADSAFCNRRKTIYNSMKSYFGKGKAESILKWLESCGVSPEIRGEKLEPETYFALGEQFDYFFD